MKWAVKATRLENFSKGNTSDEEFQLCCTLGQTCFARHLQKTGRKCSTWNIKTNQAPRTIPTFEGLWPRFLFHVNTNVSWREFTHRNIKLANSNAFHSNQGQF